jgi:outer membrane protein
MKGITVMRVSALAASLSLALAAPVLAQTAPAPAGQAPQAPRPAGAAPAQQPSAPPTPSVQVPFPAGAKYAYVNLPLLTQLSADGKAAAASFQAEQKKKMAEAEAKANKMKADQQRLETGGSVMSADARSALEKDIERQQRDGERFEQDAQQELNDLQNKLQTEYNKKLFPVLEQLAKDHGLQLLFSAAESGLIWAEPGLDLTLEAVKKMDALSTTAAKPAATPAPGTTK